MTEPAPTPDPLAMLLADLPMEELAFTPVPTRPRHDGWTPERQRGFIARLALAGSVATAARGVGKNRDSAYALRRHPGGAGFAAAWDKALGWGRDLQADIGLARALEGEVRPVFYRGRKVGEYVRHDNRLVMAALSRLGCRDGRPPAPLGELGRLLDAICPNGDVE